MAKIHLHAGDWGKGTGSLSFGCFTLPQAGTWKQEAVLLAKLSTVEPANEESVKRLGGTVGWGAVGAVVLGPVGLLAGLLAGGRGKDVTFVATFKDGRKMLATTDSKTYVKIQSAVF